MSVRITNEKPAENLSVLVKWPAVPRIGDSVCLQGLGAGYSADRIIGEIKSVVWWEDGSVRVVVR